MDGWKNGWRDRRKDRQTRIYRTLEAMAGDQIKHLPVYA